MGGEKSLDEVNGREVGVSDVCSSSPCQHYPQTSH